MKRAILWLIVALVVLTAVLPGATIHAATDIVVTVTEAQLNQGGRRFNTRSSSVGNYKLVVEEGRLVITFTTKSSGQPAKDVVIVARANAANNNAEWTYDSYTVGGASQLEQQKG